MWKVMLGSFLSPPTPFPNSLFLIGAGLFSATVTKETSVTIATVYVKSVALYLLKCSIYTHAVCGRVAQHQDVCWNWCYPSAQACSNGTMTSAVLPLGQKAAQGATAQTSC